MKFFTQTILFALVAAFGTSFAAEPKVILRNWTNKTPNTIEIHHGRRVSEKTDLAPGKSKDLNIELKFAHVLHHRNPYVGVPINEKGHEVNSAILDLVYKDNEVHARVNGFRTSVQAKPDYTVYVDGTVEGDNLEKTHVKLVTQ